ncbi:MAG: efflux RND transporter periplasmic adaptor subunit [Terracidiphilus sp.]|jgi:cobalt-zinc-cadmium efflux system membrane fusion protein
MITTATAIGRYPGVEKVEMHKGAGIMMKSKAIGFALLPMVLIATTAISGCKSDKVNADEEAPPPAKVVPALDPSFFAVEHPELYPIATSTQYQAPSQMSVTGTVFPDISRTVPVISLASGRIVDIRARLGDAVRKGQLLLRVRSDDISGGFDAYRKAVSDELLARKQLDRAKLLYEHGAIAQQDLEVAQDTEDDAKTTLDTATEHLHLLGSDPTDPKGLVDITAPVSGVITDQEVAIGAAVQAYSTPNPFTISDLTTVWIVCDVYENDMANVRVGDPAEIKLNAYPDKVLKGTVSNIGSILDPNIRTAKVRIEVANPGEMMRPGMFASITLFGKGKQNYAAVPASAIVHLHDRDWVYIPADGKFKRVEVVSGEQLPDQMQVVLSGVQPGQQVVTNAINLENAIDNE